MRIPGFVLLAGLALVDHPAPTRAASRVSLPGLGPNGHGGGLLWTELAKHPLAPESFRDVPALARAIRNPNAQAELYYIVRAALPENERLELVVDGVTLTYQGSSAIAPEWRTGPCDVACQEWMTAYILASTNPYGVHILINYRSGPAGPAWLSTVSEEEKAFMPIQEAAFFGNMFKEVPEAYVCRGHGFDALMLSTRICGREGAPCGMDRLGSCSLVDNATGRTVSRRVCEAEDPATGGYSRCYDRLSLPGGAAWPENARAYERVITVFIKDSRLGD